jgi:L-rhamnose-H+ transport protein
MLSSLLYGIAVTLLGNLGPVVGWALFLVFTILTSQLWGILAKEWKGAGKTPLVFMTIGIFLLFISAITISLSFRI